MSADATKDKAKSLADIIPAVKSVKFNRFSSCELYTCTMRQWSWTESRIDDSSEHNKTEKGNLSAIESILRHSWHFPTKILLI